MALAAVAVTAAALTLTSQRPTRAAATTVIASHPRLWLGSQMVADIAAKRAASDPDWVAVKASADAIVQQAVPKVTIIAASNTNPVQFTSAENLPWTGTARTVYLAGASGAWTAVNNQPPAGAWAATKTGSRTFTIPVNASSFGTFTGPITFFMAGGEDGGYITYGASGSGWKDAFTQLGIVYRVAGGSAYSAKALELLNKGVAPRSIFDALFEGAGELLMRNPGILALHATTFTNAIHYAFEHCHDDMTRRVMLLPPKAPTTPAPPEITPPELLTSVLLASMDTPWP